MFIFALEYGKIYYMTNKIKRILKDIKSIKIQGATNIAKASIGALFEFSKKFKSKDIKSFGKEVEEIANELAWARPDEPLNQNLLNFILKNFKKDKNKDISKRIVNFQKFCRDALDMILKNEESITANGIKLMDKIYERKGDKVLIFTHCNSSSVGKILTGAYKTGIAVKVYDSETRPRFQGRILAKYLAKAGVDVTMMTDSAAPFVISKNDPDRIDIDMVIIGADVVGMDGSVLNKIGSYSLALAAKSAGVPFYAATSLVKVRKDIISYRNLEIEKRDPTELWQRSLKGLKVVNYAFDTVPPKYITGFITEFGIIKPKEIKKTVIKNYKDIFKN